MVCSNIESKMTPSMISEGGSLRPSPPSHLPINSSRTFKEFDNLVCTFHGISDELQVFSKTVTLFDGCRFKKMNKKIYLITGPKLGGRGGLARFSQKPKFDHFF